VAEMNPNRFVIASNKAGQIGGIFIGRMRNGRGSTCVVPWCGRARDGAKVSMPVSLGDLASVPEQGYSMRESVSVPPEWKHPKAQSVTSGMIRDASAI